MKCFADFKEDRSTTERKINMNKSKYVINYVKGLILIIVTTIIILVLVQFMKNSLTSEDYSILLTLMAVLCIKSVIITTMHNKVLNKEE